MPRYFFEVRSETTIYEDSDGEVFPSDGAALEGGQQLAAELSDDTTEFHGCTLWVLNVERNSIGKFAIRPPERQLQ